MASNKEEPSPPTITLHPVLIDLGLVSIQNDGDCLSKSPSLGVETKNQISSLEILHHLLVTNQINSTAIRASHAHLQQQLIQQQEATPVASVKETSVEETKSCLSRRQQKRLNKMDSASASTMSATQTSASTPSLNFERHIALRIYYNGEHYSGLAENVGREEDQSIEKAVFAALVKSKLIASRDTCGYSRCGRTDRGVSAAGQVIALRIKSAFRTDMQLVNDDPSTRMIQQEDLPKNSIDELRVLCPARNKNGNDDIAASGAAVKLNERVMKEYSYDKILNNLLHPDIRVLGWCPVSREFSARFSATSRTYRYFFVRRKSLNLESMSTALSLLVGKHDFRNFCRMDVEKVYNFERTIYRAEVKASEDDPNICWFEIHGQAFLWHQIRCIAAILFLIGQGLESPDVVRDLLNVSKYPGKPSYQLAADVPLVLHSCDYENLQMGYSVQNLWNVVTQQEQLYEDAMISAARIRNCISSLHDAQVLVSDVLSFVTEKLNVRRKKQLKSGKKAPKMQDEELLKQSPFGDSQLVQWKVALEWMKEFGDLVPEPYNAAKDSLYVPLMARPMGPTYEEKVANLQQSAKRQQRYEENVIKKRKTREEDAAFYQHMVPQGGSNV